MDAFKPTDLPAGTSDDIILVQPQKVFGVNKRTFLEGGQGLFSLVSQGVMDHYLIHFGSLSCCGDLEDFPSRPISFRPCGRELGIRRFSFRPSIFSLSCMNPECEIKDVLICSLEPRELNTYLFHLMFKQILPPVSTCNYLDCSRTDGRGVGSDQELKRIQRLGLISIGHKLLWGKAKVRENPSPYERQERYLSLGFMLLPGMKTLKDCDGFDAWLRFLIVQKFEQLKESYQAELFHLLGPEPAK